MYSDRQLLAITWASAIGLVVGLVAIVVERRKPLSSRIPAILLVLICVGAAASTPPPSSRSIAVGRKGRCLSNVREIGFALLTYSADCDDRFPEVVWSSRALLGLSNEAPLVCPAATGRLGYAMNERLVRQPIDSLPSPQRLVLVFESDRPRRRLSAGRDALVVTPRHSGKNVFGFVDGHVGAFAPSNREPVFEFPAKTGQAVQRMR